jgi:hypothetical protein
MRTILTISMIIVFVAVTLAQQFNGKYFDNEDYLLFEGDSVKIDIQSDGGLTCQIRGIGKYEIIDEFLLINTGEYNLSKSIFTTSEKDEKFTKVLVRDENGDFIPFVNISYLDKQDKIFGGGVTDFDGICVIENHERIVKIRVSFVGYNSLIIDFKSNFDYQVILANGLILENQVLVFKINAMEMNRINLTLLSINFNPNRNIVKSLKRLDRKANKSDNHVRLFVK